MMDALFRRTEKDVADMKGNERLKDSKMTANENILRAYSREEDD